MYYVIESGHHFQNNSTKLDYSHHFLLINNPLELLFLARLLQDLKIDWK